MKKKIRFLEIRISLAILVMGFFLACQEDEEIDLSVDNIENTSFENSTISRISQEEIPEVMEYLSNKGDTRGHFTIIKEDINSNRSSEPDLIIGELQTNEILRITKNNKNNYSFSLASIESNDKNNFFNLVVKETKKGFLSFITEYRPDRNWIPNYHDSQDFTSFTGDILYFSIDGVFNAKVTMSSGEVINTSQRACDNDNGDTGNNGGNEGNDGNTSDGSTSDGSSDGNSSDGNSDGSSNGNESDVILVCETVILVISENGCDGDPCGIAFEHCEVMPQNLVDQSDGNNLFRNPCLPDVPVICHQPNTEPCPFGCNANETGCAEEPEEEDNTNPNIPVFVDLGLRADCRKLENLSNSPSFQERMEELIANNSGNKEVGYFGRTDNNDNTNYINDDENRFESEVGSKEIELPTPQDPIDSYIHNHFNDGNGTLSVFSPGDLYTLYIYLENGRIGDTNDFIMVMTSPSTSNSPDDDTVYAVTISSANDLLENGENSLSSLFLAENLLFRAGLTPNVDASVAERQLASIFSDNELGLKLYRGNKDNLDEWTQIKKKNNGDFKESACN